MQFLEAEVAKVQIGEGKSASSSANLMAEAGLARDVEHFGICELPILNPAAIADCDRLSESVFAAVRRNYKHTPGSHTFEKALEDVNKVLSDASKDTRLVSFVERVNCCIAVRHSSTLEFSSCGNINIVLLRNSDWVEISKPGQRGQSNKVFTSFSSGKLLDGDFLVLATGSLLRSVSLERLKKLLLERTLPEAGSELVKILEETGESGSSFGALLVKFGSAMGKSEEQKLVTNVNEELLASISKKKNNGIFDVLTDQAKVVTQKIVPSLKGAASKFTPHAKQAGLSALTLTRNAANAASSKASFVGKEAGRRALSLSRRTWIILGSALIALVALISVFVWRAGVASENAAKLQSAQNIIAEATEKVSEAESRQIYGDDTGARASLSEAQQILASLDGVLLQDDKKSLEERGLAVENKINKVLPLEISEVASMSNVSRMLVTGGVFGTIQGEAMVKYDLLNNSTVERSAQVSGILDSISVNEKTQIVYNGDSLRLWTGILDLAESASPEFFERVPKPNFYGGMDFFTTNSRIYLIDNETNSVVNIDLTSGRLQRPRTWNTTPLPTEVKDVAVDGSLYVVGNFGLKKFFQGKEVATFSPAPGMDLSGVVRVSAKEGSANIYLLDAKAGQVIVLNKLGGLVGVLRHDSIKDADDMYVATDPSQIFILKKGSLIKLKWTPG